MSLEPLLNAAVFQQLLNEAVRLLSLSLMHHSVSPSSFSFIFSLLAHLRKKHRISVTTLHRWTNKC